MKYILIIIVAGFFLVVGCSALKPAVGDQPQKKQELTKQEKEPAEKKVPVEVKTVSTEKKTVKPVAPTVNAHKEVKNEIKTAQETPEEDISLVAPDQAAYSVSDLERSEKSNEILILLNYKGDNPKNNITTFFSGDNFFNITFYKGKFSPSVKKYIYNKAFITKLKFIEYKESVQITVRFRDDFRSSFVAVEDNNVMISVFDKQ